MARFALFPLFSFAVAAAAAPRPTCTPFAAGESPWQRDYRILTSKTELEQTDRAGYEGRERLKDRAFFDGTTKSFQIPYSDAAARVPDRFIDGLAAHLGKALTNQYADAVTYVDMGHAHLLAPAEEWTRLKASGSAIERMEKLLALPRLKALYHTAEMIQLKDGDFARGTFPQDPWKLWRYFSRNLLGTFEGERSLEVVWAGAGPTYNTVREIPGMTEIATLYFVSHHDGCFRFESKDGERFFDMTFEIIPYRPASAREPQKIRGLEFH